MYEKCNIQGKKGSETKKARSKWFKVFLRRLRCRLHSLFSRHKTQQLLPGKSQKMQKNATTQQKMLNGPKCKKINNNNNTFAYLAPPPCYLLFLGHWLFLGRVGGKTFFLYYLFFFPQQMFFFPQCFFPLKPARSKTQFFPTSAFGARLFYPQEKSTGWEKKTFFLYYYFFLNKKKHLFISSTKKTCLFSNPTLLSTTGLLQHRYRCFWVELQHRGGGLAGAVMWYIRDSMRQEKCRRGRRRIGLLLGICLLTSARRSFHPWPVIFLQALFLWTTIYSRSPL